MCAACDGCTLWFYVKKQTKKTHNYFYGNNNKNWILHTGQDIRNNKETLTCLVPSSVRFLILTALCGLETQRWRFFTCMPCAGDCRALMKRAVSQGAMSPMSTCLFWSLGGTGSTLQSGSALMCAVLSRKFGSSPERSRWAFLDTLSWRIWRRRRRRR